VLPSVIDVHNLDGTREILIGNIPDPIGAIGDDDFLLRPTPATLPGFAVKARAKLLGRLDGGDTGG